MKCKKIKMMKKLKNIKQLLNPNRYLRYGIDDNGQYVQLSVNKDLSDIKVLSYGTNLKKMLCILPVIAGTVLKNAKITLQCNELKNESEDNWIARNEEKLIPPGFTSDQIRNDWDVIDNNIFVATAQEETINKALKDMNTTGVEFSSVSVPLWDIAKLYTERIDGDFVLLKITSTGSQLGFVKDGKLQKLFDHWADIDEIKKDPKNIGAEFSPLIKSISSGEDIKGVVVVCNEEFSIPNSFKITDYNILNTPKIENLPPSYNEAYALALHKETHVGYGSVIYKEERDNLDKNRSLFLYSLKYAGWAILLTISLCLLSFTVLFGLDKYAEMKIAPLKPKITAIENSEQKLDSLKTVFKQKANFLGRESIITFLLNEFQEVFPDGMWATNIDIGESSEKSWRIGIIANSYSTSNISSFMSRLGKIEGVKDVRLIYSEKLKGSRKTMKMKVECDWEM